MELRRAQHGLGEDRHEAQGFHEYSRVQEDVGDVGRHQREGQNALQVVQEVAPQPEVVPVKVCRREFALIFFSFQEEKHFFCGSFPLFCFSNEQEQSKLQNSQRLQMQPTPG